jgi:Glu-tRNA(Gln) amidotransferase subunit E-like FAD-binding protein
MYPETDLELLRIGLEHINCLKKNLPKLKGDIRMELKKKGLHDELIELVLDKHETLDEFNALMNVYDRDANLVGKMVTLWRNEIATKQDKDIDEIKGMLSERVLEKMLERVAKGTLSSGDVKTVMMRMVEGQDIEKASKIEKVDDNELEAEVRAIVKEKPGLRPNAYMGMVMAKLKGKVDAKKAMELLERIVK